MITPRNTFHMLTKQTRKSKLSVIKQRKAGNIYIILSNIPKGTAFLHEGRVFLLALANSPMRVSKLWES